MKQVSAIFLIFLLITISHEKELNTNNKHQLKEKISPALIQKTLIEVAESLDGNQNNLSYEEIDNTNSSGAINKISSEKDKDSNKEFITNKNNSSTNRKISDNNKSNNSNLNSRNQNENLKKNSQSIQLDDNKYSTDNNIECNEKNCFYPYGRCINNTTCQCTREYASYKIDGEVYDHYCAYERKKQLVSFLLEFFFPFGVGHFYSGRVLIGILKLIVCFSQCIFAGFSICFAKDAGMILVILLLIFGCAYVIWEFIDIILIALNVYKDGYGVPLASW